MLSFDRHTSRFLWKGPRDSRAMTPWQAYGRKKCADPMARLMLSGIEQNVALSRQTTPTVRLPSWSCPEGMRYMPFQEAGIHNLARRLQSGRRALGLMDEPGLGKTIQGIGVANVLQAVRILVVCPASLRLNWARELAVWHIWNPGVKVILGVKDRPYPNKSCVVSYDLAAQAKGYPFDMAVIDETHYLKNVATARTRVVLGDPRRHWPGLVSGVPTLFLTGTPIPNGKPNEIWPVLFRAAPDIIDHQTYIPFIDQYCTHWTDEHGRINVTGSRNEDELYARLRGSGFMVRRLKKDVLHDLPPKQYKQVMFPQDSTTRPIIGKEATFSATDILAKGLPDPDAAEGGHLATLRRQMGEAMVPQAAQYITDLLEGGVEKIGVFAVHRGVCIRIRDLLKKYGPVMIIGGQSAIRHQAATQAFQNDPAVRVFIGNAAAAEGHTLTAAHHVVDVEPEWVPGRNDQRYDRFHRIGQTHGVVVHQLVVEGSLGAFILGSAARKQNNINKILGV